MTRPDPWKKAVNALAKLDEDVVPSGFETVEQIAKRLNKSLSRTRSIVQRLRDQGLAKRQYFRLVRGSRLRRIPHYVINKKALKQFTG